MHSMAEHAREVLNELRRKNGGNPCRDFEGKEIRNLREEFDMTQSEFASAFGFSLHNIQNWERGHRIPDSSVQVMFGMIANFPVEMQGFIANIRASDAVDTKEEVSNEGIDIPYQNNLTPA